MPTHRISLKEILDAGLLAPGESLTCEPRRGEVYTGKLLADGAIAYLAKTFKTPSGWAEAMAGGKRDGWRDISARGKALEDFRGQLSIGSGATPVAQPTLLPRLLEVSLLHEPSPPKLVVEAAKASTLQDLLDRLRRLTPSQFEHLVAEYLRGKGFSNVKVTGGAGDRGIDGEAELPFLKLKVIVQAKRYSSDNQVRPPQIRELKGSLGNKFHRGVFITTSSFTAGAMEEVDDANDTIVAIDGYQLVKEMVEMQLGVKHVAVSVAVDESFFKGLGG